ncbi:MAG: TetR/AcrR family transcriptional regulator [Spirochaetes bacterium]|nr:TetR/AcrR family transcriptional regulator [Spirochaetota bacterium]
MNKTEKIQVNKKSIILEAAKKEFAEKGLDGARMESIARRAGVNKALLHYHYANKENLYKEVLIQHSLFDARLYTRLAEYANSVKLTPPEKLYIGIYLLVNIHFEAMDEEFRKIISREMTEEREHFKEIVQAYLIPRHEAFEGIIIEGIESGHFETKNPLFVIINLNTFVMTIINTRGLLKGSSWYKRIYGKLYKESLFDFLIDHTFKALRPPNKELEIPDIPQEILDAINSIMHEIQKLDKE